MSVMPKQMVSHPPAKTSPGTTGYINHVQLRAAKLRPLGNSRSRAALVRKTSGKIWKSAFFAPVRKKVPPDNRREATVEGAHMSRTETTPTTDPASDYDAAGRALEMLLNTLFARVPMVVMLARHTTTISANITAYSTAVGPSSDFRKRCTFKVRFFIVPTPLVRPGPGIKRVRGRCHSDDRALPHAAAFAAGLPRAGQNSTIGTHLVIIVRSRFPRPKLRITITLSVAGCRERTNPRVAHGFAPRPCERFAFIEDGRRQAW